MRIRKLEAFRFSYTPSGSLTLSGGRVVAQLDGTIVKLTTDEGIVGWGEQSPFPGYMAAHAGGARAALDVIGSAVIGTDPRNVKGIQARMRQVLKGHHYARSAVDLACWDILGKAAGLPVSSLLGGRLQESFPVLRAVGIDEPAVMRRRLEGLLAEGYDVLQIKLGDDWRADVDRAHACLELIDPGAVVIFDANGNWRKDEAVKFVRSVDCPQAFVEQPCADASDCLAVRERTGCLLILDESLVGGRGILESLARDGLDGAMLKLSRFGGITPLSRVRDWCEELGVPVIMEDGGAGDVIAAASAHLAASTRPDRLLSGSLTSVLVRERLASEAPRPERGHAAAPAGAGLGLGDVDETALGEPILVVE
jgi:L-alanine-DL-glutamate epimerase-like enolase superfamily enzyme